MEKIVVITEIYEDGQPSTAVVKYDNAPQAIKDLVDEALVDEYNNVHTDEGDENIQFPLQSLFRMCYRGDEPQVHRTYQTMKWDDIFMMGSGEVEFMGSVSFRTSESL